MPEYILLMHNDAVSKEVVADWGPYLESLGTIGVLRGGSAVGTGMCTRRGGKAPQITAHLVGFVRIEADSLEEVRELLKGNPVYEAGGTVEIRELPRTA